MALQGTLSDFSIDEVLRMLDLGKKQGRLRVTGGPGGTTGNIWVDSGRVLGSALGADAAGDDHTEVAFQLMRLEAGEFHFHADESVDTATLAEDIDEVLEAASARLAEWRELAEVLPALDQWLVLSPAIAAAVTVEPAQWAVLAQVGSGMQIEACVDSLGMGLVPGCRVIAELVDRSLLVVTADQPARIVEMGGRVNPQLPSVGAPVGTVGAGSPRPVPSLGSPTPSTKPVPSITTPAPATTPVPSITTPAPEESSAGSTTEEAPAESSAAEASAEPAPEDDDTTTDEAALAERAASDATGGDEDDDVNPRALLRLLNSVK